MKTFFAALIGVTVLWLELAMLILSAPDMLVTAVGVATLATELIWARHAWRKAKGMVTRAQGRFGLRDWRQRDKAGRNSGRGPIELGQEHPAT
jgi:hypothetical protein